MRPSYPCSISLTLFLCILSTADPSGARPRESSPLGAPLGERREPTISGERTPPRLRLCTGSTSGHYYHAGLQVKSLAGEQLEVEVLPTKGSWENLSRVSAEQRSCDAFIAQEDAYRLYLKENPSVHLEVEPVISLYPEQIHILCNRQVEAERLADLDHRKSRLLIAPYGSGTYITWTFFKHMATRYQTLQTLEDDAENSFHALVNGADQCMLSVGALARGLVARANDEYGDRLRLLSIDDPEFMRAVGPPGNQRTLYRRSYIHRNSYPRLQDDHLSGYQVLAILFLSSEWRATHSWEAEEFIQLLEREQGRFLRAVY